MSFRLPIQIVRAVARSDSALAGVLGATLLIAGLAAGFSFLEAAAGAVLCVPLAWRSRWPLRVLGAVAVATLLYLLLANDYPAFVPPLAVSLYTIAALGERRRTLVVAAAVVPCAVLLAVAFSPDDGSETQQAFQLVLQGGLALAVGEAVRSRRALVAAMRQRTQDAAREHEREARRRVDEERLRIARDVHDVVAHSLATIATQASVGVHLGTEEPERAVAALRAVKEVSTGALHDLRQTLGNVRGDAGDAPTRPTPSIDEVPELIERARRSGLSIVLKLEGSPVSLPSSLQVAVYRIVQEGLTNIMRHATGAEVVVRIAVEGGEVEVEVSDDGGGAPTAAWDSGSGAGLIGMRERATALGGEFAAGRGADGGFRVHAVLPRDPEAA